mmetsp:Transcript_83893/g.234159  ORF Transcript_83893/g.234159 Transcript_83893/m.234159 type:complete len:286 (-) Transcript_83893:84-941(-)
MPPDAEPLELVLALQGMRPDRSHFLLQLYKPLFRFVVLLDWARAHVLEPYPPGAPVFWCLGPPRQRFHYHASCFVRLLNDSTTAFPSARGLLTLHMDFWFRPSLLTKRRSTRRIWQLGPSIAPPREPRPFDAGPRCLHKGEVDASSWHWMDGLRAAGEEAVDRARRGLNWSLGEPARVCRGWVDLFYLPRRAWKDFRTLAPYFRRVFHESAVPTMLHILASSGRHPTREWLQCWGGPHDVAADPVDLMRRHVCGHKLSLHSRRDRGALAAAMREEQRILAARLGQ